MALEDKDHEQRKSFDAASPTATNDSVHDAAVRLARQALFDTIITFPKTVAELTPDFGIKTGPTETTSESGRDQIKEGTRLVRRKGKSNSTFNLLSTPGQDSDGTRQAMERCEGLICKLNEEFETLKHWIKSDNNSQGTANREKHVECSIDGKPGSDEIEEQQISLRKIKASNESSGIQDGKHIFVSGVKMNSHENKVKTKNNDKDIASDAQKTTAAVSERRLTLKERCVPDCWTLLAPCCKSDTTLDETAFIKAWKEYNWSGAPPRIRLIRPYGKCFAVLMETPEDREKSYVFKTPTTNKFVYCGSSGDKKHFYRFSEFARPHPMVYRIDGTKFPADQYAICTAFEATFSSTNFQLHQMVKAGSVEEQYFIVFLQVPTQTVKRIQNTSWYSETPRHYDLVAERVCYACKETVEHTDTRPCKNWRHLTTHHGGSTYTAPRDRDGRYNTQRARSILEEWKMSPHHH